MPKLTLAQLDFLNEKGCLKMDCTTFDSIKGKFEECLDIEIRRQPGKASYALQVRTKEER